MLACRPLRAHRHGYRDARWHAQAVWDTTLASRLHPHGEVLDYVNDQVAEGTPVRIAAPAILEIAYGYQRMVAGDHRYGDLLAWFTRTVATSRRSGTRSPPYSQTRRN